MLAPVTLRRYRSADRAFILGARCAAFGTRGDAAEDAKAERALAELPFFVVEDDGVPVGYAAVMSAADHDFLHELAVLPRAQSRGIGTAVVRSLQDDARRRGVPLRLSVHDDNRARLLYERLGFVVTEVAGVHVKMEWRGATG
jgi:ribosomal protein S18 acetylase RimI-like enzyme